MRLYAAAFATISLVHVAVVPAADVQAIPAADWIGKPRTITGLEGTRLNTIGYPAAQKTTLRYESRQPLAPGLYRLQFKLRSSHVNDETAWSAELAIKADGNPVAKLPAIDFARVNEPEWRQVEVVHRQAGPLKLELAAIVEPEVYERGAARRKLKQVDKTKGTADDPVRPVKKPAAAAIDDDLVGELTEGIGPDTQLYFALDAATLTKLAGTAFVSEVTANKLRYVPGETLHGTATIEALSKIGARGTLELFLEHGLDTREPAGKLPVEFSGPSTTVNFDVPLPKRELGHALVARFVSPRPSG